MNITTPGYQGILLPDLDIGFDYSGSQSKYTFISHAHADHMPRGSKSRVYCTPHTHKLMQKRGFKGTAKVVEFEQTLETGDAQVTFYPAGHILGSAMVFVESDKGNVLYTGDCRTPPTPASEGFALPDKPVDYLITEATLGLPIYKWDSHDHLAKEARQFASQTLDDGYTPVFLAYDLGKAQEVMQMLAPLDHPMQVTESAFALCQVYEEAGYHLGNYEIYDPHNCEGKILITTTTAINDGFASTVFKKRLAYCSGWAVHSSNRSYVSANKRIALSDHLDFFELINLCKRLNPKEVYLTHTPSPDVVQHYLGNLNIDSQLLS
jgi:putative mRNA 3-end processing factor